MPTKPIIDIVGSSQPELENLLKSWAKYCNEIVNFGSHIFNWIVSKPNPQGDKDLPNIMSFRNALELIDSISILLEKSSIEPCKLQLRTLLETIFTISYITEKDSETRAYNYLVCHYHEKINFYKRLDIKTQQGKQFSSEIKRDRLVGKMDFSNYPNLQSNISNLTQLLKKNIYSKSEKEYQRLKRKKNKPVWYQFFNGPNNIIGLADHLKLIGIYNILYRFFSKNVHGQDIIDGRISEGEPGYTEFMQIKDPTNAQFVCQLTVSLSIDLFRTMVHFYIPEKKVIFEKWYTKEIRDFLLKIISKKLLTIT